MKMPIVDGLTSTKIIRASEVSLGHAGHSPLATINHRIPIFAVSASLLEQEKDTYVNAGFDGWILKPVDFKRLSTLLTGIWDEELRTSCLYKPGEWERGGWFSPRAMTARSSNDETTSRAENEAKELGEAAIAQEVIPKEGERSDEPGDLETPTQVG